MKLEIKSVRWDYAAEFRISYSVKTHVEAIEVHLSDDGFAGRGEGLAVFYNGECVETMRAQLEDVRDQLEQLESREELLDLLPPGGARNAVDCALWDLEAKRTGRRAWELAGIPLLDTVITDRTLSLDAPDAMAREAVAAGDMARLKLKLGGAGDVDRVAAVRAARPDAELIVDANQGWSPLQLEDFVPELHALGVLLIEQPLPVGEDHRLLGFESPIPICADESCQTAECLPSLIGKYSHVNIKLDKTGGLTAAFQLANAARSAGVKLMVGCMGGSSLSMAPALLIAQQCEFVDLDGPLLTVGDRPYPIRYDKGRMSSPERELWG